MNLSKNTLELMKEFTQTIGVSGNEVEICKALQKYYKKYADEIIFDNLGSVFAVKRCGKSNAPKVLISGHMDEIGFVVKDISKEGLIRILPLGAICKQGLIGQRVKISNGKDEKINGYILSTLKEESKVPEVKDMAVDIGSTSREEVAQLGIKPGDSVVVAGEFQVLANEKRLLSKGWNNGYGCVMGIEVLESLKDEKLDFDLYVGCTVQHEVGLRGAQTSTNLIAPDLGIVLDCLSANDATGDSEAVGKLGHGVLINYYDKSMMPNRALLGHLTNLCKEKEIKHQPYFSMGDGDGGWIHKLLKGCPTLNICICGRNLQSNSGVIDVEDYIASRKAIIEVIKSLSVEKIQGFKAENR